MSNLHNKPMNPYFNLSIIGFSVAAVMAASMILASASPASPDVPDTREISWTLFCESRGYDPADKNNETINEYLDTWVGSIEEEHAFNNLPALD